MADGGVVQAAHLATLALEVVDDQGVIVPGMPALNFMFLTCSLLRLSLVGLFYSTATLQLTG